MACGSRIDLKRGVVEVDGDDASEVQAVVLGIAGYLRELAREHPNLLEAPTAVHHVTLGDQYNVQTTSAAVGRGAALTSMILAEQLAELRGVLRHEAESASDDLELGALAEAELAATQSDEAAMHTALAKLSARSLKLAEQIGIPVAVAAISRALGLA